jgi:hypothetical protein
VRSSALATVFRLSFEMMQLRFLNVPVGDGETAAATLNRSPCAPN